MFILSLYIFYWIIAFIGLTIGFHRCISHRHVILNPFFESITLWAGTIASACSPLSWAGVHRMHHAYSDTPRDPHSPKYHKWYEILFSMYRVKKIPRKFVKDLYLNPRVMFFHKNRLITFLITYIIAYMIYPMLVIYFLLLIPISFISYGMINCFGHDENGPVNKWWINLFAPFEGNHNDHHKKK